MNTDTLTEIVDGITDIAAIGALGYILVRHPDIGIEALATIASVALGKKYLASR